MKRYAIPSRRPWPAVGLSSLAIAGALCAVGATAGAPAATGRQPSPSAVPYTPSKTPGVVVRSIPSAARPSGARQGSIFLLPGGKLSDIKAPPAGAGQAVPAPFVVPGGGVAAFVPPEGRPYALVTLDKDGRAVVHCEPGAKPAGKKATARKTSAGASAKSHRAR